MNSTAISPDGLTRASVSPLSGPEPWGIEVYDQSTNRRLATIPFKSQGGHKIAFSHDSALLAWTSLYGASEVVHVWNIETRELPIQLHIFESLYDEYQISGNQIDSLWFSPDRRYLLVVIRGYRGTSPVMNFHVWNVIDGNECYSSSLDLPYGDRSLISMRISGDGIVTGSARDGVRWQRHIAEFVARRELLHLLSGLGELTRNDVSVPAGLSSRIVNIQHDYATGVIGYGVLHEELEALVSDFGSQIPGNVDTQIDAILRVWMIA
jgi:WD40 repeat protein